jgi:hypothetical protein
MSMKKTDLVKNLAKKLDGRMKSAGVPHRFAQGAADAAGRRDKDSKGEKGDKRAQEAAAKLVPITCRLPAELVARLRERAVAHEGGINALMAQALERALQ